MFDEDEHYSDAKKQFFLKK